MRLSTSLWETRGLNKLEIETFEEEEKKAESDSDGVNFHEIPEFDSVKPLDLSNKQDRIKFYENIYKQRREQKKMRKWRKCLQTTRS